MNDKLGEEIKKILGKDELFTPENTWRLILLLMAFPSNKNEGDDKNV